MRKILNRGAKRRLRRKQQTARRRHNRIQLRGMEPLEDRRLLSVSPDNNWVQLFNPNNGGVTQTVQGKVTVSHGTDAALALSVNYTDTLNLTIELDLDNDGKFDKSYNEIHFDQAGNPDNVEGVMATQPVGNGVGELNSLVFVVPIGLNDPLLSAMDRMVSVRITGGPSTDILATAGSYHGVSQTNPINNAAAAISNVISGDSKLSVGNPVPAGNRTLDSIMTLERTNAQGVPIAIVMKPDRLDTDPSDGNAAKDQVAVLNAVRTTAPNAVVHGAASSDDDDLGLTHDMNWGFLTAGVQAFAHVAVDINMGTGADVEYDGGDADKSYGIAIHAPKGASIGPAGGHRDKETLAQVTANQGPLANGDDLHVGTPDLGAAGDDEDINPATMVGTNKALNGMFISKNMGSNEGEIHVPIELVDLNGDKADDPAYLTIYVDWGRDGSFIDAIDQVVAGVQIDKDGTFIAKFNIPPSAQVVPGKTAVRARIHSASMGEAKTIAWNDQHANDGEVEDFLVELVNANSVHGVKFEDFDGDGTRDGGDTPMAGVAFDLFNADGSPAIDLFGKDVAPQFSDAAGKFWFDNLAPNNPGNPNYVVKELLSLSDTNGDKLVDYDPNLNTVKYKDDFVDQGLRPSTDKDADKNGVTDTGVSVIIEKQGQAVNLKQEFGNFITGSIHGVKFHDVDGDGVWDADEKALPGIKFDLYKFVGIAKTTTFSGETKIKYNWEFVRASEPTNVHGEFWFENLDPGRYELFEQAPDAHMTGMEWVVSTGQQQEQDKATRTDEINNTLMMLMGRDPNTSSSIFEIISRREFVWTLGAASHAIDGLGDENNVADNPNIHDLTPDGQLEQAEIDYGKAKAALKVEILAGSSQQSTIVDSKGFELPGFTTTFLGTGQLEGQPAGDLQVWQRTAGAGTSTATVQNTVFAPGGGNQAVQIVRAPNAVDRWGVPVTGYPLTNQICIEWDMRVNGPVGTVGTQFGPFYGVEAYDDTVLIALLGSLGVDATTGDVLYQAGGSGFFVETGATVAFGTWHEFDIILDYSSQTYAVYLDDILLKDKIAFVDNAKVPGGLTNFTDADITALTAAGNSGALTGTGFFDNFTVKDCGTGLGPSLVYGDYKPGKISGVKFEDIDLDGDKDATDPGMANVWMLLKDGKGNVVQSTKTDGTGMFMFSGLRPGTYSVSESTSTVVGDKANQLGTDTNFDGIADILQDMKLDSSVATLTILSGESKTIEEDTFGNYVFGSIHGVKFRDTNGNGVWDKSAVDALKEDVLKDVVFNLYRFKSQKTTTNASNVKTQVFTWEEKGTAKTNSHGEFWFTGLVPGIYEVVELPANNPGEILSTGQPTKAPTGAPGDSKTAFEILSRREFVWEIDPSPNAVLGPANTGPQQAALKDLGAFGAFNRPIDGMGGPVDNIIDSGEVLAAYNKAALKIQILASPAADPAPADKSQNLWFGNFRASTITGVKFEDLNLDGTKQANEPGMQNVWMVLTKVTAGDDGKIGTDDDVRTVVTRKLTEADGKFTFGDLMPGIRYEVTESLSVVVGSKDGQFGTDTNNDGIADLKQDMILDLSKAVVTPNAGETVTINANTFGNYIRGSIHGVKFHDANGNGVWDTDETPLEKIKFHLWKLAKTEVILRPSSTQTETRYHWTETEWVDTDVHGEFWFTGLLPGKYTVTEDDGDYFLTTGQNMKSPDEDGKFLGLPSDSSSVMEVISRREWVWKLDPSKDAVLGPANTAAQQAALKDNQFGAFNRPLDGFTQDFSATPGDPAYGKTVINLPGNNQIDQAERDAAYNKAALKIQVLASPADDPAPADKGQSLWFGNVFLGTIHGFKYEDKDNDGKFNNGDVGLADIWMLLIDGKGNVAQATKSVKDDPLTKDVNELGKFWFSGVRPGTYRVEESTSKVVGDKAGQFGSDTNLDGVADVNQELVIDPFKEEVTVTSQLNPANRDVDLKHQWANFILGSIHGVKFQDFDRDGRWDREGRLPEPAWEGIKFHLYYLAKQETKLLASNITKVFNTWEEVDWMATEQHGEFWFTGLVPGWYEVREEVRPDVESTTGQTQGPPGVFDTPQESYTSFLIRSRLEYVWEKDPNGAGPGLDPPYGAFNRPRDLNNDGFIDSAEQDMAKNKSALKAEVLADGIVNKQSLIYGNNFITGSIHGFKFEDIDADGIYDQASPKGVPGAEPGLGGIWIELHDKNGKVPLLANGYPAIIQTGPDGKFWFNDVMPGTYTIHEILEKTDSNGDSIPDIEQGMVSSTPLSTGPITVLPRQEWVYKPGAAMLTKEQIAKGQFEFFDDGTSKNGINEKLIFGNYILGSVHGFKFLDTDADGKYEPEHWQDMPFEWGAFELLDANGKSLGIVYSDNDGEFWFEDLKPGKYTLRERPDLIDRNDLDGDGFPDIVDTNGDGLPEFKGNGIPDDKEGLRISTHDEIDLQIWSGEELVWKPGAAHLLEIDPVHVEPDKFPDGKAGFPVPIGFDFPNVELTEVISDDEIVSRTPFGHTASTGTRVFGQSFPGLGFGDDLDTFSFAGNQGVMQARFTVPVRSVSIDVIADSGNDRGVMVAYDIFGNFLGQVTTPLMAGGQVRTLTFNAPGNNRIGFVQVAGDGLTASTVGLDNLRYVVDPLKEEKFVGTDLMFGNFYTGAIHGLKFQQGSNTPAPNIPIQLVDQWGVVKASTTTNADGEFWFLDVVPGFYTINEVPTPAIIVMATPVPVVVGHAQAIFSADIPSGDRMFHPGLQTPISNHALTLRNLIEGSIHGLVCNQNGQPIAGYTVVLAGPENAQVTTNSAGQFHFNDLTPGAYVVNVGGQLEIVIVGSGEEEVAQAGLAGALDPGQFEFLNPELKFTVNVVIPVNDGPRVTSVKVSGTEWSEDFLTIVDVDPIDLGYKIPGGPGQLDTLPWINVNEVHVTFSEGVVINASQISLNGVSVANYSKTFSYNAATFTATLLLPAPIGADKLVLTVQDTVEDLTGNNLDGEWTNGGMNYPSGNGTEGADFNFRFNVLPGDSNRNGSLTGPFDGVLGSDVIKVRNAQFLTTVDSKYSVFDDVNGSGNVSGVDVVAVRNRQFTGLPAGSPVAPAGLGASLVDSVFSGGDGGAEFGKSAAVVDASDDSLLLLALGSSSESSTDSAFSSASDDGDGDAGAGSIDDMFAALGA